MTTEKLYWRDPWAVAFEGATARASVSPVAAGTSPGPSLVLDRTLFYPEAGGQLADRGELVVDGRVFAVTDVQIDEAGAIHHHLAEPSHLPEGARVPVSGRIDAARRRDFMAQHTAQHMLSRALLDEAAAETVSSRLGETSCTLDLQRGNIPEGELARAEDVVNAAIRNDLVVHTLFPTAEELAALPLRRPPKVREGVRVVDIEGFDVSPCGGTHCTRTGQIGVLRIVGVERYKGMTRVTFHAAARALHDARAKERVLLGLAQELTCGALDVPAAVARLRADLKEQRDALSQARGELVELLTREALAAHPAREGATTPVALVRASGDLPMLRTLAGRLAQRADVVAFCAAPDGAGSDWLLVVQRGAAATFDCGAWFKRTAAEHGGRGGGRPERAEGRLPATVNLAGVLPGSIAAARP